MISKQTVGTQPRGAASNDKLRTATVVQLCCFLITLYEGLKLQIYITSENDDHILSDSITRSIITDITCICTSSILLTWIVFFNVRISGCPLDTGLF